VDAKWRLGALQIFLLSVWARVSICTRTCLLTHPMRGNFTTYLGERCIYHMKGGQYYGKTKPELCYATEDEAVKDGCRRSKR